MNPTLAAMFNEPWAMQPDHLAAFAARLQQIDFGALDAAAFQPRASDKAKDLDIRDGVAHISVRGVILKSVPQWAEAYGINATGTESVRDQLARAVEDSRVNSIMLDVDSPGGSIRGLMELGEDLRAARDLKPVNAHASDLMASAAYWIGCQASRVTASKMANVGSIGVYTVAYDLSKYFEKYGFKVHVISTHELKGAGVMGSEVSKAQLADIQRQIDELGAIFTKEIASGRKMDEAKVKESATGQCWLAAECVTRGLIDGVESPEEAHKRAAGIDEEEEPKKVSAPLGAQPEESMADEKTAERLAQLEREKAEALAREKATKAALDARVAADRTALVDKHADRVAPAARKDVEAYGEFCGDDLGKFEAYLLTLPKVTRPATDSRVTVADPTKAAPTGLDAGDKAVAKALGIPEKRVAQLADVVGYNAGEGTWVLADGSTIDRDEAIARGIVPKTAAA